MATEARETAGLIGSDKVEGTNVYGATGEKIGSIERVMIDKRSGHVAYAVLSFGGFLGIGSCMTDPARDLRSSAFQTLCRTPDGIAPCCTPSSDGRASPGRSPYS